MNTLPAQTVSPSLSISSSALIRYAVQLTCIALLALAAVFVCVGAVAAPADSASGAWKINGNGFVGDLQLTQSTDGSLIGQIYGEPAVGFYAPQSRAIVLVRGSAGAESQVFVGTMSIDGTLLDGTFYALNATTSGATSQQSVFVWRAQRGTTAPTPPNLSVVGFAAGPSSVTGLHVAFNQPATYGLTQPGQLTLTQTTNGAVTGTLFGDSVRGMYARGTGTLALLRMSAGTPVQVYVGKVDFATSQRLTGWFYALTPAFGANLARLTYDWSANLRPLGSLSGAWRINGNGFIGDLNLTQAADGRLSGAMYGDPVTGYYAPGERTAVLLRGSSSNPSQAFVGQLSADGANWSGSFYALSTGAGASAQSNAFSFSARRAALGPPAAPAPLPAGTGFEQCLDPYMTFVNRPQEFNPGQSLPMTLYPGSTCATGRLTGMLGGDDLVGYYSPITGALAFLRRRDGNAFQFYVGQAGLGELFVCRFTGSFYALTSEAGAVADRMRFNWSASAGASLSCP